MSSRTPGALPPLNEPLVRLSPDGETRAWNPAFAALAERHGRARDLRALFGPPALALLAGARRDGAAIGLLALAGHERGPATFRVSVAAEPDGEIVALLVDVTEETSWRDELFERNRELRALGDIGPELAGTLDVAELAERVWEQTRRVAPDGDFYMALLDRERGQLTFPICIEDGARREAAPRPLADGLTEYVLRSGEPLLLNRDVREEAVRRGIRPRGRECRSWLAVPVRSEGEILGVLALQHRERSDAYDLHALEIMTLVAAQAAAAIRTARLFAATQRAHAELGEAQDKLLRSERLRAITETVGALNHEINNPLAAIVGNAQLLLRQGGTLDPSIRTKLEAVLESARRIQRVTAKMESLIQTSSMPYPGQDAILDVRRSVARGETPDAA